MKANLLRSAPVDGDEEFPGGTLGPDGGPHEAGVGRRGGADGRRGIHTESISAENGQTAERDRGRRASRAQERCVRHGRLRAQQQGNRRSKVRLTMRLLLNKLWNWNRPNV